VEQNLGLVLSTTERVYVLRNGRNVFEGATRDLENDSNVLQLYLQ